ncbi:MAG: hypothetical protein VXV77_00815 [Bacteroidota bacterium]|nr:hypothetical protein [Bacteroidota bacterium]MEC8702250.1 hypothetical protein [Bacteroidota bacterium]|tara:strand:- start:322 stop:510 length:189 start_codon:yes stop_codon:yes gene_type:complete
MFKFIKLFKPFELVLLILVLVTIVVSEIFFFNDEPLKAVFLGLWAPTILLFILIFNQKKKDL